MQMDADPTDKLNPAKMKFKRLPLYCLPSKPLEAPLGAVVHYFSAINVDPEHMFDPEACLRLFRDLNRAKSEREHYMLNTEWPDNRMYASAHLLITRNGSSIKMAEFDQQAYHAGASIMNGRPRCNKWTIGIELIGHKTSGFTSEQYDQLADILVYLHSNYGIERHNVQGHDHVRYQAIQKGSKKPVKYDPSGEKDGRGHNFDWLRLWSIYEDLLDLDMLSRPTDTR